MSKIDRILNRFLTIFIFIGIGQLIAISFGKYEVSNVVLIGYVIMIPLGILIAVINDKTK